MMLLDNRQQLLAEFDKNVSALRAALASVSDAEMMKNWRLLAGGQEIFSRLAPPAFAAWCSTITSITARSSPCIFAS